MVRTMSGFISLFLLISVLNAGWSSRLCPRVTSSFRTFSSSPCSGPLFISAKPYLLVTQHVNNVPVILSPDDNGTKQQDKSDSITQEKVEIQEQDIKIDVEESTTVTETVLSDDNETNIEEEPVAAEEHVEDTDNIENGELKNMPPIFDLLGDSGTSNLD